MRGVEVRCLSSRSCGRFVKDLEQNTAFLFSDQCVLKVYIKDAFKFPLVLLPKLCSDVREN